MTEKRQKTTKTSPTALPLVIILSRQGKNIVPLASLLDLCVQHIANKTDLTEEYLKQFPSELIDKIQWKMPREIQIKLFHEWWTVDRDMTTPYAFKHDLNRNAHIYKYDVENNLCYTKRSYKNGYITSTVEYKKGRMDGMRYSFRPNGALYSETMMKKDLRNGQYIHYHTDGVTVLEDYNYFNDLKHGPSKKNRMDGSIKTSGFYYEDQKHGTFYHYDASGNLQMKEMWNMGVCGWHGVDSPEFYSDE